jgi:hypothetical protein
VEQALEAMKQVQALPPKETDAPPVSETDPEARRLKQATAVSPNLQIATDAAHGIIVGVGVTRRAAIRAH